MQVYMKYMRSPGQTTEQLVSRTREGVVSEYVWARYGTNKEREDTDATLPPRSPPRRGEEGRQRGNERRSVHPALFFLLLDPPSDGRRRPPRGAGLW